MTTMQHPSNDRFSNDATFQVLLEKQRRLLSMVKDEAAAIVQRKTITEAPTEYVPPTDIMIPSKHLQTTTTTISTLPPSSAPLEFSSDCAFVEQPFEKYIIFEQQAHDQQDDDSPITRMIFDESEELPPKKKRRVSIDTDSLASFEDIGFADDADDDDDDDEEEDGYGAFTVEVSCDATTVSRDDDDLMNSSSSSSASSVWGEANLPTDGASILQSASSSSPSDETRKALQNVMLQSVKSQGQIQEWERTVMGLKRSHSQTMRNSKKTRQALLQTLLSA